MKTELYRDSTKPIEERARDLLSRMNLNEKLAQLGSVWSYDLLEEREFSKEKARRLLEHGIGQITRPGGATGLNPEEVTGFVNSVQEFLVKETRLGIPALMHDECLAGFLTKGASIFPQPIAMASTWSPELVEEVTGYIRSEMRAVGVHQGLAPVLDVAHDPRWGRTEETFGEDPYLVASMGAAYVRGLQGDDIQDGVVATVKHFVGYSASEGGLNCAPEHIPERELREVFLFPFERVIRETGALAVMNSYGELDGIPCAASRRLLTDVLRGEWGFPGIVVSDYSAIDMLHTHHRLARDKGEAGNLALEAGIDVELPAVDCYGTALRSLLEQGLISPALVDTAVLRVLKVKFLLGLFEQPYVDVKHSRRIFSSSALSQGRALSLEMARKSIVLLKNDGLLPLREGTKTLAVIGPSADEVRNLLGDYSYPAHLELFVSGTGEGEIPQLQGLDLEELQDSLHIPTVLGAIQEKVPAGMEVVYAKGCAVTGTSRDGFSEAIRAAKKADVAVVALGDKSGLTPDCTSGETRDVANLKLPGVQEELILELAEAGVPIVLVLVSGRPYSLSNVIERVNAAMVAWLPGESGGEAIAEVLFGESNPGGKLPISFPRSAGQLPVYYYHKPSGGRSHFWGDYVDESTKPLFPFGHGLSYTTFEYSGLAIEPKEVTPAGRVRIKLRVRNTGEKNGDEVVQLYIKREFASVTRPVKELKGFKRVSLSAGEEKAITFELPMELLAFYDRDMMLVVEPGSYQVLVGGSSEDIRLSGEFIIKEKSRVAKRGEYFTPSYEGKPNR